MAQIRLLEDYFKLPKTRDLMRLLGRDSELLPIRLWYHYGERPGGGGRIAENLLHEVEPAIGWTGQKGQAIEALEECWFLTDYGDYWFIVDWEQVAGHILKARSKGLHAIQSRWKNTPSNTPSITPSINRAANGGDPRAGGNGSPSAGPLTTPNGINGINPRG